MPPPAAPRILLVRFSSLGDLLLVTPLLRALRRRHPRAHLALVTSQPYAPLFSHNPRLDDLITYEPGTPLPRLAARVRRGRYTHRLDLHASLRSRALALLAGGRWSGYPKHRVARAALIVTKRNRYHDARPVAERYFDAARRLDVQPDGHPPEIFCGTEAIRAADGWLGERRLARDRALVAVVPGAAHATKRWPEHHWAALITGLVAGGRDVVVLGGPAEERIGARLEQAGGPQVASAAGRFDLQGTAALLKRARAAVAGDTGVMHLATAVGTPVVALMGPTVAAFGFRPYAARATVLERELPCRPCSRMGGPRCPLGHHACLEGITPDQVLEALRRSPR